MLWINRVYRRKALALRLYGPIRITFGFLYWWLNSTLRAFGAQLHFSLRWISKQENFRRLLRALLPSPASSVCELAELWARASSAKLTALTQQYEDELSAQAPLHFTQCCTIREQKSFTSEQAHTISEVVHLASAFCLPHYCLSI